MRHLLIICGVLAVALTAVPAALATTQTVSSGGVTASFSFNGKFPNFSDQRLTIAQGASVLYNEPVVSSFCGKECAPLSSVTDKPSVHVVELEGNGQPNVVLDLYTGGAHCCGVEQVFSYDPGTMTYAKSEHNFGDPGARIEDLAGNGRYEFLTADDAFAYAFTDYAASGLPVEVLSFSAGHFVNVTRSYPKLIARDAAVWLKAYKSMAKQHYSDSVGVIAAWAADEDELGNSKLVNSYLAQQAKAGHLNSALIPQQPGRKFVAKLQRFLRSHGYLR